MIFTIAARELRSLFLSPLAWVILSVVQLLLAIFFSVYLYLYFTQQAQLNLQSTEVGVTYHVVISLYSIAATIMMFIMPLITMRIISDEKRNQSIALLYSAPLSMTEIVLGKYLGLVSFVLIMTFMYTLMPLSLLFGGTLDWGLLFSALIGTLLFTSAIAAIGMFMSSLTNQPMIAAVSSFFAMLFLWILNAVGTVGSDGTGSILSDLSLITHLQHFHLGIFSLSDFVYYLIVIAIFVVFTIRKLDSDRLRH